MSSCSGDSTLPPTCQRHWGYAAASILPVSGLSFICSLVGLAGAGFHTQRCLRYCLVGIGIIVLGVVYWAVWRIVLPHVFGYHLVPRKETLDDGTVITLVSPQTHQHTLARYLSFRSVLATKVELCGDT